LPRAALSRIAAAVLCADVRGFTNFAEETAPEEVTRRLNGIFDCLGDPVRAAGGEILKFLLPGASRIRSGAGGKKARFFCRF
jgi:class 3 adenylate cyclase